MRPISWLHVSDIHMSMRDAWSQDLLLTAMCRRIEKLREDQELGGWSSQIDDAIARIGDSLARLRRLAIGGTAVGTGINTHPEFAARVVADLTASNAPDSEA